MTNSPTSRYLSNHFRTSGELEMDSDLKLGLGPGEIRVSLALSFSFSVMYTYLEFKVGWGGSLLGFFMLLILGNRSETVFLILLSPYFSICMIHNLMGHFWEWIRSRWRWMLGCIEVEGINSRQACWALHSCENGGYYEWWWWWLDLISFLRIYVWW